MLLYGREMAETMLWWSSAIPRILLKRRRLWEDTGLSGVGEMISVVLTVLTPSADLGLSGLL